MAFPPATTPIFDVPISRLGFDEAIAACDSRLAEGRGGSVLFVNVHTITEAARNADLRSLFSRAFLAMPDGMPLVWVSRFFGEKIRGRVCGPDFMTFALTKSKPRVYGFIGGSEGQGEAISKRFGVVGVSYSPPYRPFSKENARADWEAFIARVRAEGLERPRWVWVGLGAPKQERWMDAVSEIAPDTLFFGVGAAFDFLAGAKARAPVWMRAIGLEWLYRFLQEPGRLWKRYVVTHSLFIWELLKHPFTHRPARR